MNTYVNDKIIIKTRGLTKEYKRFQKEEGLCGSFKSLFHREYIKKVAVDHFDLEIRKGEFVGLIGPNGAGKTTLVKMLTGIIAPTKGEIDVLGYYPNKLENEFKRQYAVVMGQKSQLFFELTASDTLHLFKELYGISDEKYRQSVDYFVKLFQIEDLMNVQVRTLSLGERMKMELIVALLHEPKILFLDEPTIGLDAIASRQIRKFLKEVNQEKGTTILLTSHYMEDIKELCPRSVVVNHGEKLYDGPTDVLFDHYQKVKKLTLTTDTVIEEQLLAQFHIRILEHTPYKIVFTALKEESTEILSELLKKVHPLDISVEEEEIGKVVERIYQSKEVIG